MTLFFLGGAAGLCVGAAAGALIARRRARRPAPGAAGSEHARPAPEAAGPHEPPTAREDVPVDEDRPAAAEPVEEETVDYRGLLADWYWSMPYVRKLLGLVTEKTNAAAMGLIDKYEDVHGTVSAAGDEARSARETLSGAGEGRGVDALIQSTREQIVSERARADELAELKTRSREQTEEANTLIERVHSIVAEIGDIADRSKVISINLGIEAAKIGRLGGPFKVIADQLRTLNGSTAEASNRASVLMDDFSEFQRALGEDWQQVIDQSVTSAGESTKVTEETIETMVHAFETTRAVFDTLIERAIASQESMDEILQHLQFQDITRQQVENVDEILQDLVEETRRHAEGRIELEHADTELIARLEDKLKRRFKVYDEETVLGGNS